VAQKPTVTTRSRGQASAAKQPKRPSAERPSPAKRAGADQRHEPRPKPTKRSSPNRPPAGGKTTQQSTRATTKPAPRGRDQIVESIIDATLSLWASKGPAELSLRGIAARAGVNYGLVHRHFRTKEAVIRAAMDRVVERSVHFIEGSNDLVDAMDKVLPPSTGAHARLLAWSILQYHLDDILPSEDRFLTRLRELAAVDIAGKPTQDSLDSETLAKVKAGSMLATLYGWKLFEPYLVRGLGLEKLSTRKLNALVRENVLTAIKS
jgi:TetR/AcrR family transcriptional regulator, repressor for neighboring sulfatase